MKKFQFETFDFEFNGNHFKAFFYDEMKTLRIENLNEDISAVGWFSLDQNQKWIVDGNFPIVSTQKFLNKHPGIVEETLSVFERLKKLESFK